MEPEDYYLCFSGLNLAGAGAEDNFPSVTYGTNQHASDYAYEEALQLADESLDDGEDEEFFDNPEDNLADSFVRKLNQKDLDNCGVSLIYEVIREINRIGQHTVKEVEEKYGVSLEAV